MILIRFLSFQFKESRKRRFSNDYLLHTNLCKQGYVDGLHDTMIHVLPLKGDIFSECKIRLKKELNCCQGTASDWRRMRN